MTRAIKILLIILSPFGVLSQGGFFVQNKGQLPDNVLFHARLTYGDFYIEKDGFVIKVLNPEQINALSGGHHHGGDKQSNVKFKSLNTNIVRNENLISGHVFKLKLIGAKLSEDFKSNSSLHHKINYYLGSNPNNWASNLIPHTDLTLKSIYAGIDLRVYFKENSIKYDFIVHPKTDPDIISLKYENVNALVSDNLVTIITNEGIITDEIPYSYFKSTPNKQIKTRFKRKDDLIKLEVSTKNSLDTLVIDPQLNFSTFTGAREDNWGYAATYDDDGYGYAGGIAFIGEYPVTMGAFQTIYGKGDIDIAISKFTPDGKNLEYSTYIGGNGSEAPHSLITNSKNELIIYGVTSSTNYPTTETAFSRKFKGGNTLEANKNVLTFDKGTDIIISKLSASGNALVGSTYFGGSRNDALNDAEQNSFLHKNYADVYRGEVTVDSNGNIFVSSVTESIDLPIVGGFQPSFGGGNQDGCVAKFKSDLSSIIWSSYFGGSGDDACYASKQNSQGETYITGGTTSGDLPTSTGAYQVNYKGNIDGYVAQISGDGSTLLNTTYFGSDKYDQSYLVDVDQNDFVYCFGQTLGNFILPDSVYKNENSAQFLTKFSPNLNALKAITLIGDGKKEINIVPSALMISNCNEIYISGWGGSTNNKANGIIGSTINLPVTSDAYQKTSDSSDFFFLVLEPNFKSLKYATFFGGSTLEEHVDGGTSRFSRDGTIYQAVCGGCGGSSAFPVSPGAYSEKNNSTNCNLVLIKMDISKLNAELKFTRDTNYCEDSPITLFNESNGGKEYEWIYPDGTTSNSYNGNFLFPDSGNYVVQLVAIDSSQCPYRDTAAIDVNILMYPKIEFDIDTFLCEESQLKIKTIGGPIDSNYTWYTKDTVYTKKNGHVLDVSIDTTTTFNVSYVNRCGISVNSIKIPRYYTPKGKLKTDTVCENEQQTYFFPIDIDYSISEINSKPYSHSNDTLKFSGPSEQYIIQTIAMCGSAKDTFDINRIDIYPKLSNDTILCPGEFANLTASGGYRYKWGNELETGNPNDTSRTFQVFETNYFPVSIHKGICHKRDSIEIKIYPKPFQEVKSEYKIYFGEEVEFPVNPSFNYSWTPLDYLKTSNRTSFSAIPQSDITYYFTYKSDESCNLTDSILIKVIFPLYVPNTFTPNGDGKNEEFGAYSQVLDGYDIHIFDRWGNLAFHSTSLDKKWNGTINGNNQQEDVYVYIIKYKLRYTNKWEQKVGRVNLIR